jgi:hypothetical protein
MILKQLFYRRSFVGIKIQHFYCKVDKLGTLFSEFSKILLDRFFPYGKIVDDALCSIAFQRINILFRWKSSKLNYFFQLIQR